jgi:hypothetical protein
MNARRATWLLPFALCIGAAMLLGGCALPRRIDSEVQSFAGAGGAARNASYRLERVPSQNLRRDQDRIEAMAVLALSKVGLTQDAAQPNYTVQVDAAMVQLQRQTWRPWIHHGFFHGRDGRFGMDPWMFAPLPSWYQLSVHLLMRDALSSQVAYETSAVFEGPWSDAGNLLPVLFDAALHDYPAAPAGLRVVVTELPAASSAPPP